MATSLLLHSLVHRFSQCCCSLDSDVLSLGTLTLFLRKNGWSLELRVTLLWVAVSWPIVVVGRRLLYDLNLWPVFLSLLFELLLEQLLVLLRPVSIGQDVRFLLHLLSFFSVALFQLLVVCIPRPFTPNVYWRL